MRALAQAGISSRCTTSRSMGSPTSALSTKCACPGPRPTTGAVPGPTAVPGDGRRGRRPGGAELAGALQACRWAVLGYAGAMRLDHVVMPVPDAETTLEFYTKVLELPLVAAFSGDDWDGYPWLMMIFGLGGKQELVAVALRGAPAPDYRGVPVDARHYALAAGAPATSTAGASGCGRPGSTTGRRTTASRVDLLPRPDGVIFEITWPPPRAQGRQPSAYVAVKPLGEEDRVGLTG